MAAAHRLLAGAVAGLTEQDVRQDTALPGWTRAHLLRHLADLARAFTRQVEHARAHQRVEVYDGGRAARDASITTGAALSAERLITDAATAMHHLDTAFDQVADQEWLLPCDYRDGTLHDVLLAWWREVQIHTTDLDLPGSTKPWPPALCWHLLTYLSPRLPDDSRVFLEPTDVAGHVINGEGPSVRINGRLHDIAAWISGREPVQPLTATPTPLPNLGPWP